MTTLIHLAPLAATSLTAAIWQSTLLVLCVALLLRLLPGITAAARSLIWTTVFLLTLALPFVHLSPGSSAAGNPPSSLRVAPTWAIAIAALWIALSLLRAARLFQSAVRLYRVATKAIPMVATADVLVLLASAPSVRLCTSNEVDVPSVAGFFHPRILLPTTLLETISPGDLHKIVLHELEHLRRRDDWTNLLQKLALVFFPLNPVLLWVERRLCLERELACDDGVLLATDGAAKAYATCLANLAEASLLRRGLSLALGAWHRQSELARRVHRILRNPPRRMRPAHTAALAALTLAATLGTGLLAAKSPQLITFGNTSTVEATAAPSPVLPALHPASIFHPTLVEAVLPQPSPVPANLTIPRNHAHHTRTLTVSTRRPAATPNIVLIGWQPAQRLATSSSFQLTYAAVPTRTGWLFFQL